jgi:hypothetical protein
MSEGRWDDDDAVPGSGEVADSWMVDRSQPGPYRPRLPTVEELAEREREGAPVVVRREAGGRVGDRLYGESEFS